MTRTVSNFMSALLSVLLLPVMANAQQAWNFRVLLDDKPIGMHRFEVDTQGDLRTVRSDAEFSVKLLGLTIYGYQHQAREQWQGDCLRSLQSSTRDGGKLLRVELDAGRLPPCTMSYAYWNPRLLQQTRLVNPQTGNMDEVKITALGQARIDVRGTSITAQRWRISGLETPIDLWYAADNQPGATPGEWLGLDSKPNGRLLSYRLQ